MLKTPNPRNSTLSPRDKAEEISSNNVDTHLSAWRALIPGFANITRWTSSDRVINFSSLLNFKSLF
jgi:hypothetical protein